MKTLLSPRRALFLIGSLAAILAACASSSSPEEEEPAPDLTAEDIERNPAIPIEKALMARVPGLLVSRGPDGGLVMRIRGQTSINASTVPLFIIDGMPVHPDPNGSLTGLNPYDIESIEVVKDAAGTARYGVRGANGVILITTKRAGG